jgi:arabinose-5-phosphate isomerase
MRQLSAKDVMRIKPRVVRADALAVEAADLMEQHRINSVLVIDANNQLCGAVNTHDLLLAKVI